MILMMLQTTLDKIKFSNKQTSIMGRTQKENKMQENRSRSSRLRFWGVFLVTVRQERVVSGPATLRGAS